MHKLIVLYPEPDNRQEFIDYYTANHLPLAARLPGLVGWRYSLEVSDGPAGTAPYFAVFEAEFAHAEAFRAAMASPEGQAVGDDVPNYATGGAIVLDYAVSSGGLS
ncbi:EthD family reductase [Arthrobacter sp. 24S4-2]|uniref:EthD family reductase n=1 Tax=Arthrobacter sp. 24S4-2 TaxID=2575374 RepID=UPI0010C7E13A|nr:EthD family reductase [Arthrobacter sp. 24S4-2]QCP00077.1 EthD family reductase [Arthrobacter sp. 24S4-2]